MKKTVKHLLLLFGVALAFSSCKTLSTTATTTYPTVLMERDDFNLSQQFSATATTVRVFYIDWAHLFTKRNGYIDAAAVPTIGGMADRSTERAAVYNLLKEHPEYDVVMYPRFETEYSVPFLGIGFILIREKVTVTARLGKVK